MSAPRIVLASGSPRRRLLLEQLGLTVEVRPAHVNEAVLPGEKPGPHVERLAREKVAAVAGEPGDALVIGGDTVVVLDGEILGKPRDAGHAVEMLLRLEGREHRVDTGVAVAAPGGAMRSAVVSATVRFRPLGRRAAEAYVATGEPMDKAGAYGIQGYGSVLVEEVRGDYFAVMGLPVQRVVRLFEDLGYRYEFGTLTREEEEAS